MPNQFIGIIRRCYKVFSRNLLLVSVNFVHSRCNHDAFESSPVEDVAVTSSQRDPRFWLQSKRQTGGASDLDGGMFVGNIVAFVMAVVVKSDLRTKLQRTRFESSFHVGDLGVEFLARSTACFCP